MALYILIGGILYLAGIITGLVLGNHIMSKRMDGLFEHMKRLNAAIYEAEK